MSPGFLRTVHAVTVGLLLGAVLQSTAGAVTFTFDDLPTLWNAPEAFPAVNFNGGAEVTFQNARSAPHAIMLYGEDLSPTVSYGYYLPYTNLNIPVTDRTRLEYWIFPVGGTTSFAVDIKFSDGTYLRDYPAEDQFGVRLHAGYQGAGGYLSEYWGYKRIESNIGLWVYDPAHPRTITQIIVAWDRYPLTGWNNAIFDDISITETPDCSSPTTNCAVTACRATCSEAGIRDAIDRANTCSTTPDPTFTRRTISLGKTCSSINVVTNFDNDPNYNDPIDPALELATCPEESGPFRKSICIKGNDIAFDGTTGAGEVTLTYLRTKNVVKICDADLDSAGPAAFVLRGNRGAVRNLTTKYFDEGIVVRRGDANVLDRITCGHICDEAITIGGNSDTPTFTTVRNCTLTGFTCDMSCKQKSSGTPCLAATSGRTCGTDKAIQVLSGTDTKILNSQFTTTGKAILIKRGNPLVQGNTLTGHATMDISDSITVDGDLLNAALGETVTATINANTFRYQKYGIRAEAGGWVNATNNILTDCYVNAFSIRESRDGRPSRLRAAGNRVKNCGTSGCNRGAFAIWNEGSPQVDFGGGAISSGAEVVAGFGPSPGGNVFCQGQGTLTDFYRKSHTGLAPGSGVQPTCTGTEETITFRAWNNCFSDNAATITPIGGVETNNKTSNCNCTF
jgi:hypothetical protein